MDDVMEIEIVPDENMQEPDVEIILGIATSVPESHDANLAEHMSEKDLQNIASELLEDFENDQSSRKEWVDTYVDAKSVKKNSMNGVSPSSNVLMISSSGR